MKNYVYCVCACVFVCICSCPWAVAAEREAGYIMLGSMCAAAAPGLLAGRSKQQQVLELFSVALGPTAADALTAAAAAAGQSQLQFIVGCGLAGWWALPAAVMSMCLNHNIETECRSFFLGNILQ